MTPISACFLRNKSTWTNVDIYLSEESSVANIAAFGAICARSGAVPSVSAVQGRSQKHGAGQRWLGKGKGTLASGSGKSSTVMCYSCEQKGHYAKLDNCPAKDDQCQFSHNKGHWKSCCCTFKHSQEVSKDTLLNKMAPPNALILILKPFS